MALWLGMSGCSAAVPTRTQPAPRTAVERAPVPVLAQRIEQLTRAVPRSVVWHGAIASGFMARGVSVTTTVEIPAGRCVTLLGMVTAGVRDLDAHVFDDQGELLAEDVSPDAHPTVQVCARSAMRVHHLAEAFDGIGAFAVVMAESDDAGANALLGVAGGRPGVWKSDQHEGQGARTRLAQFRNDVARAGFAPAGEVNTLSFTEPGEVHVALNVRGDQCYTLAAMADDARVSIVASDNAGDPWVEDTRGERDAFVQLCPSATGTLEYTVRAHAVSGRGPTRVFAQALAADAVRLGGVNALWLGERWNARATSRPLEQAWSLITARAAMWDARLAPMRRVRFVSGEEQSFRIPAPPAGQCAMVALAQGNAPGRASLRIADPSRTITDGRSSEAGVFAVSCASAETGAWITLTGGAGELGWSEGTMRWPAWAERVADKAIVSRYLTEAAAAFGHDGWPEPGAPAVQPIDPTRLTRVEQSVEMGQCVRVVAAVDQASAPVRVRIADAHGATVAEQQSAGSVRVTACNAESSSVWSVSVIAPRDATSVVLGRAVRAAQNTQSTRPRVQGGGA